MRSFMPHTRCDLQKLSDNNCMMCPSLAVQFIFEIMVFIYQTDLTTTTMTVATAATTTAATATTTMTTTTKLLAACHIRATISTFFKYVSMSHIFHIFTLYKSLVYISNFYNLIFCQLHLFYHKHSCISLNNNPEH